MLTRLAYRYYNSNWSYNDCNKRVETIRYFSVPQTNFTSHPYNFMSYISLYLKLLLISYLQDSLRSFTTLNREKKKKKVSQFKPNLKWTKGNIEICSCFNQLSQLLSANSFHLCCLLVKLPKQNIRCIQTCLHVPCVSFSGGGGGGRTNKKCKIPPCPIIAQRAA